MVFLHHLMAVLDDWDPRVIDGIAAHRRVIAFDNRGVGASGGSVPHNVEEMGEDAIAFIRAMGLEQVDLLGFSLGGGVAQMVALQAPRAGTPDDPGRDRSARRRRPRGDHQGRGRRLRQVRAHPEGRRGRSCSSRATPTASGPRRTTSLRLKERTDDRDKGISLQARRAQLKAIRAAGLSKPDDLSVITQPVFVANGDHDLMVASSHSADMARRIPNSRLRIYPNSGHGGVFQHHREFVTEVLEFLDE